MTFNFLGPGLTVNVEAKVKEQIILDSSGPIQKLQTTRFDKMQKPNSVEHGGNGIGKLLVTFPVCEETKQNGSRIAVRSRL